MESQLNPNYTFENFVEGDCNRLARSAGYAVAGKPGGTAFNPLLIYGGVGMGKTHLAHAIGIEIKNSHPGKTVLYVTVRSSPCSSSTPSATTNRTISSISTR